MIKRVRKIYFRTCGLSDEGRVYRVKKKGNQDNFLVNNELGLIAVADGIGGQTGGQVASKMAIDSLLKSCLVFFPSRGPEDTFTEDEPAFSSTEEALKEAFRTANKEIYQKNAGKKSKTEQMGTTLVCAKIHDGKIYVVNSGDSRCYLIRKEAESCLLTKLTEDHSPVEEIVQAGRAEASDPKLDSLKRYVKGSLGAKEDLDPDIITSIPQRGDIYLLCSDGLSKMLSDEKIRSEIVESGLNIEKACQRLVAAANEAGGHDNVTVLLMEIVGIDSSIFDSTSLQSERAPEEDTFQ